MKLLDVVRWPLMLTDWNPPPGARCTPGHGAQQGVEVAAVEGHLVDAVAGPRSC